MEELVTLLYPIGLFNQRASTLVRFSQQYIDLGWPNVTTDSITSATELLPLPDALDVKIFHGAGIYASDSFRIYSDLLPGKGGPEKEGRWLEKRGRASERMRQKVIEMEEEGEMAGVEGVAEWMSDEEGDDGGDEWRSVRAKGRSSLQL